MFSNQDNLYPIHHASQDYTSYDKALSKQKNCGVATNIAYLFNLLSPKIDTCLLLTIVEDAIFLYKKYFYYHTIFSIFSPTVYYYMRDSSLNDIYRLTNFLKGRDGRRHITYNVLSWQPFYLVILLLWPFNGQERAALGKERFQMYFSQYRPCNKAISVLAFMEVWE